VGEAVSESGWRAECQDCPVTVGGYGERVWVCREFPGDSDVSEVYARAWAIAHADRHGHDVRVTKYHRMVFEVPVWNPELFYRLIGFR